jgi:hypothetical protein
MGGTAEMFSLPASIAAASASMTSDCEVQERKLRGAETAVISRRIDRAGHEHDARCAAFRSAIQPLFAD